ncbi:protein S100-Z [Notolabrus celidotus]|uniref:protein S100-Z n=1 Tax=Notolabrus celidotus TaxID=1203425 RepID=UPI00148F4C22|nr:protein S100-Z [Notolabrus celidotus]
MAHLASSHFLINKLCHRVSPHLNRTLTRKPQSSPRSSRMPSQLEGAMDALISVFYNYSGNDGDKYKLNKGELKDLLTSELTDFLTSQKDPMLVEKIMNDLDSNKDNEVDFNEFVVLVAALTVACNDFFQEQKKKTK